jgi:exopolyphosphatase / guanosine-5'-triphosphate,3'-diphosphate pyrophosphatase
MAVIIPRWEWRVFGTDFGVAEDALAALTPGPVQDSNELYLLSGADGNVKVRDDLLDIKLLREVDADGLERWEPVMKRGFPLSAAVVPRVFDALGVVPPVLTRDTYSIGQFLTELVEPSGVVRTVKVHKRRVRYILDGCMAEIADLEVGGRSTRTIAVESEDASAVIAAVRGVGLAGYGNTSYPRGLAALVDAGPGRYAVLDVGTNSVKFHIGERGADGRWRAIVDRAEVTRLGEGLGDHGAIAAEPLERTTAAIAGMVEELSGEEEGRIAYLAARAGLGATEGSLVVFDTGGGSSQFTFGRGPHVEERFSVEVGAVRYTERFGLVGAVDPGVLADALAAISADLTRLDGRPPPDALVAMGGAVTNITAVKLGLGSYDPDLVQGTVLDRAELDRQIERYRSRDAEARRAIVGLQPKRAEIILAGACIVRTVMEKLGQQTLTVSDRGLRHGLLIDRFGA